MLRSVLMILTLAATLVRGDEAVLDAWLKRQASVRSLDTAFIQERKLPSLKNPVTTPGRLSFSKPDKVRWQLGEPAETLAISDGHTFTLIDTASKTARRVPADSPQATRFSLLTGDGFSSPQAFRESFEIIGHRVVTGIHQFTIKPRERRLRGQVPWIFLDIDPRKNELRALEFEFKDKSRIRTIFTAPRLNANLPANLFQPDLTGYQIK